MGNTIEVKLKEDKPALEVTETLVEEFKGFISMADHSVAGLAKSMDAMSDACEMLLRQLDKDPQLQDATTGTDSEKFNSQQLARHLLEIINASISDHKFVVMASLSKLFNFMWDVAKPCIDNTENGPLVFLVDKCKADRDSVGLEDGVSYTDLRLRSLQREIKILRDKNTAAERELKNLNNREDLYRKEIETLEKENTALKEKIVGLTEKQNSEVEVLDDEMLKSDDIKETTDLRNEYNSFKQEHEPFKTEMITANGVTVEYLNRRKQMYNDLEQEMHNLIIDFSREMSLTVDKGAPVEDSKGLIKETKLREETDRSYKEVQALTTAKVLHGYEYGDQIVLTRFKKRIKEDLYEDLKRELATCNVNFKISTWCPSSVDGTPMDKVIIVPMFYVTSYETLNSKIQRALQETNAEQNAVFLYFYDADRQPFDCGKMNETLNDTGRFFEFRHFNLKQSNTEMNNNNFKELLHFLKMNCMEGSSVQD